MKDDSTIMFSDKNPEFSLKLESGSEWLINNKLSIHLGKTECILFWAKVKEHPTALLNRLILV